MTVPSRATPVSGKTSLFAQLTVLAAFLFIAASAGGAQADAHGVVLGMFPLQRPVWRLQCVDCPFVSFEVSDRSLALDAAGRPHVAYTGDQLFYAYFDGAAWQVEAVDAAPGSQDIYPSPPSLVLDATGAPHISYLSAASRDLRYARRSPQGWVLETVDSVPAGQILDYDTAIALNQHGHPRIAYFRYGRLHYAAWTGDRWDIQLVDRTTKGEFHVSLALDAAGQPHISYGIWRGAAGLYLKYAHRRQGVWYSETVEDGFLGEGNSIALDSHGLPHISYLDYTRSQLKLARRSPAGAWQIQVVDDLQWFGGFTSLALDAADQAHITYAGPPRGVRYARWDGAAWQIEVLAGAGWSTALALDQAGRPHMVYFDTGPRSLVYGRRDAASWRWQTVDRTADVGQHATAARTPEGALAVAYYEAGHGDLRLAWRSSAGWQVETVDAAGDVGRYAALAFTAGALPRISYYDAANGDLKVARRGPNRWAVETVDSEGDVGQFTSLALDGLDQPLVAYYDATQGDLKLARRDSAGRWTIDVVAAEGDVGQYPSLALDPAGQPVIGFYDATHGDLCLAFRQDGRWVVEIVDAAGDVGRYTSLAFDAQGQAHISYYDVTNGDLKYAVRRSGAWAATTVDAAGDVGRHTSLALDAAGAPHIAASSAANDALRYAWWTGAGWQVQTVRAGWQTASFPSLILEQGRPRIAFYDPGWRHLRLAWGEPFGLYLPLALRH